MNSKMLVIGLAGLFCASAFGQDLVKLPPPRTDGGRPLMQVLKDRKSTREFGTNALPALDLAAKR